MSYNIDTFSSWIIDKLVEEKTVNKNYKVLYQGGMGEITEKKSRFIAVTMPIETEEEAIAFFETIRKKYWDATHHCTAFVLGRNHEIQRCNDDGEPSQTAGKPMLDVLLGQQIHNAAVVVTRYFGGTLLGTGGLVRAYSKAVQEGLTHSIIIEKCEAKRMKVKIDYTGIGKIQYICGQMNLPILNSEYTDIVRMEVLVPEEKEDSFEKAVTEATSGQAVWEEKEELLYGIVNGEIKMFKK